MQVTKGLQYKSLDKFSFLSLTQQSLLNMEVVKVKIKDFLKKLSILYLN